ncbi:MAG: response regulator [Bryobacteraceae bacterium]|nr:response regulator [Bryobacteraceae bacterium]
MMMGDGIWAPVVEPRGVIPVRVLHASNNRADRIALQHILRHTNWFLFQAISLEEARAILRTQAISVVICDYEFCSMHWKRVFDEFSNGADRPKFIVTSWRAADDVWAEALNLGAEDVLATPFEPKEVHWVVSELHVSWLRAKQAGRV